MKFKYGDVVSWTSQSRGHRKKKTGHVVAVIPPGKRPMGFGHRGNRELIEALRSQGFIEHPGRYSLSSISDDYARDHESYLVEVPQNKGRKPKLYWPRVAKLKHEGYAVERSEDGAEVTIALPLEAVDTIIRAASDDSKPDAALRGLFLNDEGTRIEATPKQLRELAEIHPVVVQQGDGFWLQGKNFAINLKYDEKPPIVQKALEECAYLCRDENSDES